MHLLLALRFIFLHYVISCSCGSVTRQLGAHAADPAPDSAESNGLKRDEIPELLKQFLEQRSLESSDGERVQENAAKLRIEPYTDNNITRIKWKKRDPAQLPKKRRKTIAPLAIIVTNLSELTRLRGRGVGGKSSGDRKSKWRHQQRVKQQQRQSNLEVTSKPGQSNWNTNSEPDSSNELDVTNKSDIIKQRDDTNELDLIDERDIIKKRDDTNEMDLINERGIIKERDDTNELVLTNEWDVINEKDDTNELDLSNERNVIKERDDINELERVVINETDDSNELDLTNERNVTKERNDTNELISPQQKTNELISPQQKTNELISPQQKTNELISPQQKTNELISPQQKTNELISPQQKTDELISPQQKTNELISPQQKSTSLKNNRVSGIEFSSSSLREGSINVDTAAEKRLAKTVVIEPEVNLDAVTKPGAGAPAQHPETRVGSRGPCAEIKGDTDCTQRQSTRNIYNISFLFNR